MTLGVIPDKLAPCSITAKGNKVKMYAILHPPNANAANNEPAIMVSAEQWNLKVDDISVKKLGNFLLQRRQLTEHCCEFSGICSGE